MKKLKDTLKKLIKTGFFSIFMSNVFAKVIAFLGNIVIVRILSKNDYGVYAYAINAMTILYIFNDFGASTAALQNLTEEKDNKEKQKIILKYALKIGFIGSLFSGLLILLSPLFYPYEIVEAKYYTPILFLVPLFSNINAFITVVFRANLENTKFAIFNLCHIIFNYIFLIVLSLKYGIMGAIVSQYFYTILSCILGIIMSKNLVGNIKTSDSLEHEEKKSFLKYALTTQVNNTLTSILINIDIFLIGLLLANPEIVASYKVASTIPMALSFLPNCVVIYILPFFINHNKDINWIKTNYIKLIKYGTVIYGLLVAILIIFSKLIFNVLYGAEYINVVSTFNILLIGFFFSATFKIPTNNILYSMRKLNINLIVTISSAILNFIFNILFIKIIGMNGAALTTMIIQIISSCILIYYIHKEFKKAGKNNEENNN